MLQLILERRSATLLSVLFIVCFTLMTISVRLHGGTTLVERGVLTLTGPLLHIATTPKRWAHDVWHNYIALRDLRHENDTLRGELLALRGLATRTRELEAQVKRLENMLGGVREVRTHVRLARIVGREASPYGQTILIDLGSADGIRRNMPVVHQAGVVGRISRVGQGMSQVLLLTDSRSAVDVIVQRTRAQGIFAISSQGNGEVRYLPSDEDVAAGDLLISSGMGGVFPKGLPVARVTTVKNTGEQLFREVGATPTVDFNRLEEVLVLMPEMEAHTSK